MQRDSIRVLQIIGIVCGGGVEAVIMNYYRNLDRSKIQFDFVVDGYDKTILDDEILSLGGKVYHVEPYRRNIFRYMKQVYWIVKKENYDIVHVNMNTLSIFSLFPAWLAGAKIRILHNHSTAVKNEGVRSILKKVLRPLAPLFANRYAACSVLAGRWMYGEKRVNSGGIKIIRNAIDVNEYAYSSDLRKKYRTELGIADDILVIGHVGRFMFQKNHAFLLKIFNEVCKRSSKAMLLLVGEGELRMEMERCAARYGIADRVRFLGLRRDVHQLYNAMDVFVLPSWYEGLPVVSVEAQANGLRSLFSTNVTAESGITRSAEFYPLTEGADKWAEHILQGNNRRNENASADLRMSGFEIHSQAEALIAWYEKEIAIKKRS
ncbi:Glycosyltransferase involved in cell wall bisynthesis [Selenomonas ruminantium]|uniref:Glycosyltransferase involved in cell wall bisynthesis n=1 Tax=Selenomonas ruminantium TaxID=971 RepID=A0A1H0NY00_SELRU|nr:Glycosyltransferase involved in cell wall bisynthesis [Selenomonas ruminantium]